MADKTVRLRAAAAEDLDQAVDHLRDRAGERVALEFVESVAAAFSLLSSNPGIGSLRYSYDLEIPGLRAWPIERSDRAVFYVEADDHLDVWRVLHTRQDIPATIEAPDSSPET
ncbi:MAG: type II toxin-antitoxin system RelE/ParE family toxin [Acidimicrobiales bacterium]|nr:type II toxin-antitoxin system RelE/ParE family toxin [Acidimicrobiales bacterium]